MPDKQLTAMQQLINLLDENIKLNHTSGQPIESFKEQAPYAYIKSVAITLRDTVEKEQIIQAHNKANENWEKGYPTSITDGTVYYQTKYAQ